jgi:hypothetical protein
MRSFGTAIATLNRAGRRQSVRIVRNEDHAPRAALSGAKATAALPMRLKGVLPGARKMIPREHCGLH